MKSRMGCRALDDEHVWLAVVLRKKRWIEIKHGASHGVQCAACDMRHARSVMAVSTLEAHVCDERLLHQSFTVVFPSQMLDSLDSCHEHHPQAVPSLMLDMAIAAV